MGVEKSRVEKSRVELKKYRYRYMYMNQYQNLHQNNSRIGNVSSAAIPLKFLLSYSEAFWSGISVLGTHGVMRHPDAPNLPDHGKSNIKIRVIVISSGELLKRSPELWVCPIKLVSSKPCNQNTGGK